MSFAEKGYIQFHCDHIAANPPSGPLVDELVQWWNKLRQLGLIGVYPDGIGFGNISGRLNGSNFIVSGTAIGGMPAVTPEHFTTVTQYDIANNRLTCQGPVRASSESLSHAAIYVADPTAQTVLHVHNLKMWESLRGHLPTTDNNVEAGTPAMAFAITELIHAGIPGGVFVMGGHREGIVAFAETCHQAGERLLALLN